MSSERDRLHNLFPDLDFDPEALRAKYRQERDRRLRDDGEDQYVEAASEFAHYADDDPYARAGLFKSVEIRAWNWVLKNPEG